MEPIMLKNVPPDRFSKMCYICEENGREVSKATAGACMQCNKNGCKMNFHVTCAQAHGHLCEEAGNYGDNVKYCGYCVHHYKKLKKDANIKTIPAFRPIPADNATPDSTPEKPQASPKIRTSGEYKNMETVAGRQLASQLSAAAAAAMEQREKQKITPITSTKMETSVVDVVTVDTVPKSTAGSQPSETVTVMSDQKPLFDVKFVPSTEAKLFSTSTSSEVTTPAPTPVTVTASSLSTTVTNSSVISFSTITNESNDSLGKVRRQRAGSLDKEKKVKKARVPTLAANKANHMKMMLNEDTDESSPPTSRRSRRRSNSLSNQPTTSGINPGLGTQNVNLFGGEPHFQNPISRSSFTQGDASSLSTLSTLATLTQSASPGLLGSGSESGEKLTNGPLVGPPKIFPSALNSTNNKPSETPGSMEELLERQWEQGSQFLMEQGQHFDIASLLNCLHQLKSENRRLEDYIQKLISRRDHLLAINARLSLPFSSPTDTLRVHDAVSSEEEGSEEVNVTDMVTGSTGARNSPVTSHSCSPIPSGSPHHTTDPSKNSVPTSQTPLLQNRVNSPLLTSSLSQSRVNSPLLASSLGQNRVNSPLLTSTTVATSVHSNSPVTAKDMKQRDKT